ncbi:MAG: deoxyguanosinetriphosphate triphosphohydrolase [Coprococcus sp.]|nr:deoxyguanosinetriphosphate triphosphohydrolase [Coprococcus sp.]
MTIRETQEAIEHKILNQYAAFSDQSKGRDVEEAQCDLRTVYQRDRDRILHCKAFRRLKHKTQVFLSPGDDHYRTRLTHTLEVSQIARTIARSLRLNEDLTEAIALGHDLGHTPFGHAGERALSACAKKPFRHNEQSVRIVEKLEDKGAGLNLTWEVRDGILNHKSACMPSTLEGQVVRLADKIAYVNHDIDDAIRGNILREEDLPIPVTDVLGHNTRDRLNCLIHDVIEASEGRDKVCMSDNIAEALGKLRTYMFDYLYTNPIAKSEETKADKMIKILFEYFSEDVSRLTNECVEMIYMGEDKETVVCDYIAGMTDNYAIETFKNIYIPKSWRTSIS